MIRLSRRWFAPVGAVLGIALAGAASAEPFDPVGRWTFHHTDGTAFTARLMADQTATTDFGDGERGIWRWEHDAVRIVYTDGWDDLLSRTPDGRFRKRGWQPGADRCAAATNETPAAKISGDPRPPR